MPLLALLLFIGLPIAELYVIIQVGQAIGVLPTIAILIADSFLGAYLLRSQGRAAWQRFNRALAERRVPGREVLDGAMIILGGALLLTPGFITDIVGIVLLLPPTRAAIRGGVTSMAKRRVRVGWVFGGPGFPGRGPDRPGSASGPGAPGANRRSRGYDYEGTATEVGDAPELPPSDERG
jgi:UPF0716 protein FxsA